jgi:alpha-mannosidase
MQNGVDFVWRAADGSRAVAHWMLGGSYGYANPRQNQLTNIADLVSTYDSLHDGAYRAAATPFMYYAVENDFSQPVATLLSDIAAWNQNKSAPVTVLAGSFADFMEQVLPHQGELTVRAPYNGTPYWTGYYASRPALKTLHYEALRRLQEAETFGLLAASALPSTTGLASPRSGSGSCRARTTTTSAGPPPTPSTTAPHRRGSSSPTSRRRSRTPACCETRR